MHKQALGQNKVSGIATPPDFEATFSSELSIIVLP